jgi:dienelactone hydrolase
VYDPFVHGPYGVSRRTFDAPDTRRGESFPWDVWRPTNADADGAGAVLPVGAVVYSHYSGGNRRAATFLTSHLASHGYLVAALDHCEVVSARLQRRGDETPQEREARVQGWIDNRVPDIGYLLDAGVSADAGAEGLHGIVGYSFGGWTALAAADVDERIGAVVALAPAGSANRRPEIVPGRASFRPGRAVSTLLVGGDEDQSIPVNAVRELFDESPWPTRLLVLRSADHCPMLLSRTRAAGRGPNGAALAFGVAR